MICLFLSTHGESILFLQQFLKKELKMFSKHTVKRWVIFCVSALAVMLCTASTAHAWKLQSPMSGNIASRTVTLPFGGNWVNSCGGSIKKHAGVDVTAYVGEPIYAAYDGYVRVASSDPTWVGWVTIDHGPAHTFLLTTVYWHIVPTVSKNTWVGKGQLIGYVGYLSSGTHFHFGVREAGYSNTSNAGALPQTYCGGYPAFPEHFIDPMSLNYDNK